VTWTHTPEADFREYRVYASTTSGFTPGSGNLVDTVSASPGHATATANTYVRVAALDKWGNELALSAEVPIVIVSTPSWQADAVDYFLTSAWGTSTGVNDTGNVTSWAGAKAVMSTTIGTPSAVRTGAGTGRRSIFPNGTLRMTSHPTGLIGIVFAIKKNPANYGRMVNNSSTNGYYYSPSSAVVSQDPSGGASSASAAWTSTPSGWHSVAIKYNSTTSFKPLVWVDGVALTTTGYTSLIQAVLNGFGDGSYSDFDLGDFAVYSSPSDANMATYGADLATKWQAP
jgi:hypothetical protein